MAKVKNKRNNGLADKVHHKRKLEANKKKINPFEVHINREKLKVLGKKSKHDKGLPGVSRAKAVQKVILCILYLLQALILTCNVLMYVGTYVGK